MSSTQQPADDRVQAALPDNKATLLAAYSYASAWDVDTIKNYVLDALVGGRAFVETADSTSEAMIVMYTKEVEKLTAGGALIAIPDTFQTELIEALATGADLTAFMRTLDTRAADVLVSASNRAFYSLARLSIAEILLWRSEFTDSLEVVERYALTKSQLAEQRALRDQAS